MMSCTALESIEDLEKVCEVAKKYGIAFLKTADFCITFHPSTTHLPVLSEFPIIEKVETPKPENFDDILFHSAV